MNLNIRHFMPIKYIQKIMYSISKIARRYIYIPTSNLKYLVPVDSYGVVNVTSTKKSPPNVQW